MPTEIRSPTEGREERRERQEGEVRCLTFHIHRTDAGAGGGRSKVPSLLRHRTEPKERGGRSTEGYMTVGPVLLRVLRSIRTHRTDAGADKISRARPER